jgi:hypothetical protein
MTKAEKEKYKDSAFIYSLEYPEGNVRYIGKTIDPKRRLSGHLYPNVNEKGGRKGNWIKSLKKKGVRPIMNIIDIVSRENANFWEIHYISLFKSFGFDLTNNTFGGDGQSHMTEETRKKISKKIRKLREHSTVWNKGIKCSEELKLKFSLSRSIRWEILQFDCQGNFIKEWLSSGQIKRELNYDSSSVTATCRGKYASFNGFIFIFKKDYEENPSILKNRLQFYEDRKKLKRKNESIIVFNLKGEKIREYENRWQAHIDFQIDQSNITACCKHQYSQIRGFIFIFKEEYDSNPLILNEKICKAKRSPKVQKYL